MTKKQIALIKLIEKYSGKKVALEEFANDRNVRTKLGKGNVPAEAANLTEDEGGFGVDKQGGLEMTSDAVIKNKDKVKKMANDGLDIEITDMQEAKKKVGDKRKTLKESPVQDIINWVVHSWNDTTIPRDAWGESSMTNGEIFRSYVYTFLGIAGLSIVTFKSDQWIKALKQAPGKFRKIIRLAKLFASGKATPETVKSIGIDVPEQTIEANAQKINEAFKRKAKIKKLTQLIEAKTGKKVVFEDVKKKVIKEGGIGSLDASINHTGQSLPDGSYAKFNLQGMVEEFNEVGLGNIVRYDGQVCQILSLETATELGDKDSEYYNVKFKDGYEADALSGYHLDPIQKESKEVKKKIVKEADSIEDLPSHELYLLASNSVIDTRNPLKNELVHGWDQEKGEGMSYFLCRNIIIAGSGPADFYGKVGSLFFLFDDGNRTTKFPKAWSTIRQGGRTRTIRASKWNGLQVSIQAVANNAEEIKRFPQGKYKLYVMK